MSEDKALVNRVARSGIITYNLEDLFPEWELVEFDLEPYLFQGLILKEKDFREAMSNFDWSSLQDKNVAVFCSADAIIPVWAYMLVVTLADAFPSNILITPPEQFYDKFYLLQLQELDLTQFENKRVVIKGCSAKPVPPSAYAEVTRRLKPVVKSLMYGEPCSTVPIFKKTQPKRT